MTINLIELIDFSGRIEGNQGIRQPICPEHTEQADGVHWVSSFSVLHRQTECTPSFEAGREEDE